MTTLYRKDKDFFTVREAGPWEGLVLTTVSAAEPTHRWTGAKMSYADWRAISAFLLWSQEETKSEAVVHLLYAEEDATGPEAIIPIVLPQEGYSGLSIKPLPDRHPQAMQDAYELGRLLPRNYIPIGSVHHHCTVAAFQSGTDEADERKKDGFHATLGYLGRDQLDFHARVVWTGVQTGAWLSDWLEINPEAAPHIPDAVAEAYLLWQAAQPSHAAFPSWWKEMILKPTPKAPVAVRESIWEPFRSGYEDAAYAKDRRTDLFAENAVIMARDYNVDLGRLAEDMEALEDGEYTAGLINLCVDSGLAPWLAAEDLRELARKTREQEQEFDAAMDADIMRDI